MQNEFFQKFGNDGEESRLTLDSLKVVSPFMDFSSVDLLENAEKAVERIEQIERTSPDGLVAELGSSGGSVFFIRTKYLKTISFVQIAKKIFENTSAQFDEIESADIIFAFGAFGAEKKALKTLERGENSKFLLLQKLQNKGFGRENAKVALDFLESKGYLDDARFAKVWLRSHCATKAQGRTRLLLELRSRGISKETAENTVNEYFETTDETEECMRAAKKAALHKKSGEKLIKYLIDAGFPYKMAVYTSKAIESTNKI